MQKVLFKLSALELKHHACKIYDSAMLPQDLWIVYLKLSFTVCCLRLMQNLKKMRFT